MKKLAIITTLHPVWLWLWQVPPQPKAAHFPTSYGLQLIDKYFGHRNFCKDLLVRDSPTTLVPGCSLYHIRHDSYQPISKAKIAAKIRQGNQKNRLKSYIVCSSGRIISSDRSAGNELIPQVHKTPKQIIAPGLGYRSGMGIFSYRISVSYDGSAYHGWQLQPGFATIQASLEHALSTALREPRQLLAICAAGRTDAGVHAVGQVRTFFNEVLGRE